MSESYYIQCRMRKAKIPYGVSHRVEWIPEKFATKGRVLKLKTKGVWENGWEVIDTWDKVTKEEMNERSRYHLYQRKASDI